MLSPMPAIASIDLSKQPPHLSGSHPNQHRTDVHHHSKKKTKKKTGLSMRIFWWPITDPKPLLIALQTSQLTHLRAMLIEKNSWLVSIPIEEQLYGWVCGLQPCQVTCHVKHPESRPFQYAWPDCCHPDVSTSGGKCPKATIPHN